MVKVPKPGKRVIVTPRMLRAGALALATMGGDAGEYELVGVVYRAMAAEAPGRFSVMNCWPNRSESFCA